MDDVLPSMPWEQATTDGLPTADGSLCARTG